MFLKIDNSISHEVESSMEGMGRAFRNSPHMGQIGNTTIVKPLTRLNSATKVEVRHSSHLEPTPKTFKQPLDQLGS